jgi:hypothetical protein
LPTDPKKVVCLTGKKPHDVKKRLDKLGYKKVKDKKAEYDEFGRKWNDNAGGSEIWAYYDKENRKAYYVRIDEFGHMEAAKKGWKGGNPHYHVESCDMDKDASPIKDRDVPAEKRKGTPMDDNNVPLDKEGGEPLKQHENYEKRFEPGAQSFDENGEPSDDFAKTHQVSKPRDFDSR